MTPTVSCIMPSRGRRLLRRQAITYFARQEWPAQALELVIIDTGHNAAPPSRGDAAALNIAYAHRPGATTGAARNAACELASGEIIVHIDDDDWYSPFYVETLVNMLASGFDLTGVARFYWYDWAKRRGWQSGLWDQRFPAGSTFCYRRSLWERHRFPDIARGEDYEFFRAVERDGAKILGVQRPDLYVYMRHATNTTAPLDGAINPVQTNACRDWIGSDLAFYDELSELFPVPTLDPLWHLPKGARR